MTEVYNTITNQEQFSLPMKQPPNKTALSIKNHIVIKRSQEDASNNVSVLPAGVPFQQNENQSKAINIIDSSRVKFKPLLNNPQPSINKSNIKILPYQINWNKNN